MARYHGNVGFLICEDNQETGMAENRAVEKPFFGTVIEHTRRWNETDHINDDLTVSNQISIVATDYAFRHASAIVYATFMGQRWKVISMRVKAPQIILTLGGIWNGSTPGTSGETEGNSADGLVPETTG